MLEQKVWVTTSSPLYPNLYVFLIGNAGIGKTRAIMVAYSLLREVGDLHFGATSMTMASLVDHMAEAKRIIIEHPNPAMEYNTLVICADELSAFMDQYDSGLIAGLTTFYDVVPYSQGRRVKDIRIKINKPQLNILSGSTPSNLLKFVPEFAWDQGFTSRVMLIYSDERPLIDVFNTPIKEKPKELISDLKSINGLTGQFGWTEEYATAMHNWKLVNYDPQPKHPKLEHYNARRFAHQLKLSMVASVDRGNDLVLTKADFNRAMGWLLEAEANMPAIFETGVSGADSKVMDEILHYIQASGDKGISEHKIVNFARERLPAYAVMQVIDIMEKSGLINAFMQDMNTGMRVFRSVA